MTAATTESTGPAPAAEEETDSAEAWTMPAANPILSAVPAPVLAPYVGLVTSVLCALGGGWLLLAPYALDIRRGAAKLPRAAAVDLETGAAIVAVALLSAILFAVALFSRLRPHEEITEFEIYRQPAQARPFEPGPEPGEPDAEPDPAPDPAPHPGPGSEAPAAPAGSDSSSALREMLTPLVAALAADLRGQDHGGHGQERGDQRPREEP